MQRFFFYFLAVLFREVCNSKKLKIKNVIESLAKLKKTCLGEIHASA